MKYIKDKFIIDLNFEILSILQSVALKNAMWINYSQIDYINMLKKELNFNSSEIKNLINYFNKNNMAFHILSQVVITMDINYNIDIDELKKQRLDIEKLREFEKLVKALYLKIDMNNLFEKYKDFYISKINEVMSFLKNVNLDDIYDFYGYKIGEMSIVISFISGNFGIKYNNNIYCVKSLKLDDNNMIILKRSIIPFLFHEFSHPYVHEILSKNIDKLCFLDKHYNLVFNDKLSPYQDKKTLLEEILVRTNEVYISSRYMNKDSMNFYIQKQLNNNVYYFEELVNILKDKFKNYNTYEQLFISEIIPYYKTKFNDR